MVNFECLILDEECRSGGGGAEGERLMLNVEFWMEEGRVGSTCGGFREGQRSDRMVSARRQL